MNIAVFGASGSIGRVIVDEALERGHNVTAAVRSPHKVRRRHPRLRIVTAHIDDAASVARAVAGHDAVVDSIGGLGHENPRISIECMKPLTAGMRRAGVDRLLVVGTAGTLEVEPGAIRKDQPDFPEMLRGEAAAQADVLAFLRALPPGELLWTYFSPPALIEAGERTGKVKLGLDALPYNSAGRSYISTEDFALATLDELEHPAHLGRRFTAVSA
jgi:putative NADH-flavin reductase